MKRFDVAVIGGGPAGSSTAISLARKGLSVIVFDKHLFPREKLCGDFLSPLTLPLLERLGVTEEILSLEPHRITAFRISSPSGTGVTCPLSSQMGRPLFGWAIGRLHLDDILLRQAAKEGSVIRTGCRLLSIEREDDAWSITVQNRTSDERWQAALLVGADGRNSRVAHRLGLTDRREKLGDAVALQLRLHGTKRVGNEVQIHLFPGGYAGLVNLGGGITNLCLALARAEVKKGVSAGTLFESRLYRNPNLREALERSQIIGSIRSAYPVYFSPRRSYGSGFLLVGDAARVTEPVTGEGVYFALKAGELAAEAASLAFSRGDLSARQLASYERASRRVFSRRQRMNRLIRALMYRPSLLTPLIRLSSMTSVPISPLVNYVCHTEALLQR